MDFASIAMVFGALSGSCALIALLMLPKASPEVFERLGKPPSFFDPQSLVLLELLRPQYFKKLPIAMRLLVISYTLGFALTTIAIIMLMAEIISGM